MSELLALCTLEEEQKTVLAAELAGAERESIEQCLAQEDCQPWFLDKLFRHRQDIDESLCRQLVQHSNCPWRIAAIIDHCKPELLEGSAVYAEIQLAHFDPDSLNLWNKLKKKNGRDRNLAEYIVEVLFEASYGYYERQLDPYSFCGVGQERMRSFYLRTPSIVFETFSDHKQTVQINAAYGSLAVIEQQLPTMKASVRAMVAKRCDLTDALLTRLAQDSSTLVKKNLLARKKVANELLVLLAQDGTASIAEKALERLPEELRNQVNNEKANADDAFDLNDEKSVLAYLRLSVAEPKLLARIAAEASSLMSCAATVHKSADDSVWQSAQQRTDLPLWAQIGLAQYSADSGLLDTFLASGDYSIQRALCDNPHLSDVQARSLVEATERIEIWAAIANRYIDDNEMLTFIIGQRGNESLWLSQLRRCLDPKVTTKELRSIHSNSECRTLVLSRLIARNPKCSIPLMRLYAHYCPQDIALNPSYGLKMLEDPDRIKAGPYDNWKVEEYLSQGYGPECLYDWYLSQAELPKEAQKCPRSPNANPNKIRPLTIIHDSPMQRRFVHEHSQVFSDYEYRMLAHVGTPTLKKNMLNNELPSNEFVLELLQDKDRGVALAAEKLAKKRKLKCTPPPASKEKGSPPAKLTLRSLGNKAARLSLAKESDDLAILSLLVQDKLADVRAEVAQRELLSNDAWLALLNDPSDQVASACLWQWRERQFDPSEQSRVQVALRAIASATERELSLRKSALRQIQDAKFSASLYQQGAGELDREILEQTSAIDLIEEALFSIQRGHQQIKAHWLVDNPHLSLVQQQRLLEVQPSLISNLIESSQSAADVLDRYQAYRPLVDKYRPSIRFGWIRDIDYSADDVTKLYETLFIDDFIDVARKSLHKLSDQQLIELIQATAEHSEFSSVIMSKGYSAAVQAALLGLIEQGIADAQDNKSKEKALDRLTYFASEYPLPTRLMKSCLNGEHHELHETIAGYQPLDDQQLEQLMLGECDNVWRALIESEHVEHSRFPDWFLRRVAASSHDYLDLDDEDDPLALLLKQRDISLDALAPFSLNALIKQFNAIVTPKKFRQLMHDNGLMETVSRLVMVEEWDDDNDDYVEVEKNIEYPRLTHLGASFGLSEFNQYEPSCNTGFYREKFPELLKQIGVSVRG